MSLRKRLISGLIRLCMCCIFWFATSTSLLAQGGSSIIGELIEGFFGIDADTDDSIVIEAVPEDHAGQGVIEEGELLTAEGQESAKAVKDSDKKINILDDYQAAVSMAQLHQRPLLIIFGAEWCSWCRKLEKELTEPEAEPILRQWVVAKIDVDANPEIAQKMSASALPALRILATDQSMVAKQEGYMPLEELKAWLDENLSQADPAIQKILFDSGSVAKDDLPKLIGFLANRSPEVRRAASERITSAKSDCAGAVVDVLRAGKLAQRLCAVEILTTWRAPIENLDPWQPESITEQSIVPMMEWLRAQGTSDGDKSASKVEAIDPKLAASAVESFINANEASVASAMSEALRYGEPLLPEIRQRLSATELPDSYRVRLQELLYRLLAGEQLRLRNSSQFPLVAGLDAQSRRDAAEKLLASSTSQDEPLIDELSQDVDVLIREMSIPKLQEIGALQEKARLARLLADKSPSVRTSVLRKLSENPKSGSIDILIQYIESETDEDLLVYAAKTLGQLGDKSGAEGALIKLTSNSSWRIRAAALDSIAEMIKKNGRYSFNEQSASVSGAVADAVLKATNDPDAFVSERASTILPTTISTTSAESIAQFLFEHPEHLKRFEESFEEYEREQKLAPLVTVLQKWLNGQDASKVRSAATVLAKLGPASMQAQLPGLLRSNDITTRIAAMEAAVQSLVQYRNAEMKQGPRVKATVLEPWFPVPEEMVFNSKATKKKRMELRSESTSTEVIELSEAAKTPPSDPSLDVLDNLFGESTQDDSTPEVVEDTAAEQDESALDAFSNFFGDEPAAAPPENTVSEKRAPSKEAEKVEEDKELQGLPSQWVADWYSKHAQADIPWIKETSDALASMQSEPSESTSISARWQHLSLLATGDVDQNDSVRAALEQTPAPDQTKLVPRIDQVLPWLLPEDRLSFVSSQKIEWAQIADMKKGSLLDAATEIDDLAVAEWIFNALNKPDLLRSSHDIQIARQLITRGLFGFPADEISPYIYVQAGSIESDDETIPGSSRGWNWLREHFSQTDSPELRAALIISASCVDHAASVKNCIGYVAQATSYDTSVKVATISALADKTDAAAFIAKKWLQHPLREVRELALDRMLSTSYQFMERSRDSNTRFVYEYEIKLPIFWSDKEPVELEILNQAIASSSNDGEKQKFKLLLLAWGGDVPLEELQFSDEARKVAVVGALAKSKRLDEAAIVYCEKLSESIQRDNVAVLYTYCKSMEHERIAKVRKRLRDKFGAEVLEL